MEIDILIDQSYFLMEEPPEQEQEKEPDLSDIFDQYLQAMRDNPGENPGQLLFKVLMAVKIEMSTETQETQETPDTPDSSPEMLPMEIMLLDDSKEEPEESGESEKQDGEPAGQDEEGGRDEEGNGGENDGEEQQRENGNGINVTGQNDLKVEEDKIIQIRRPGRLTGFFN